MQVRKYKREIINRIKTKALELGYENYKSDTAQILLLIDLTYDDISEEDIDRGALISALINLRATVLDNYRIMSIMQDLMQIYKYQHLAKALLEAHISYSKITIEEIKKIVKEVYGTEDELTSYSLMWELYRIGVLTSIKTHNKVTSCHICKSYKQIMKFISEA